MIYADNAATTKLDIDAFEAMKPYLVDQYGNASQPYCFARSGKKAMRTARENIAECIGANPEEIYFTSGGTEGDNWAIKSVLFMPSSKQKVITSEIEHHAVINACRSLKELQIPVEYLSVDATGIVQQGMLEQSFSKPVALVSVMMANNEIGTIEPIQTLCNIAHANGSLFHTDAVQAIGHIPVDVKKLGIDMLSASAHKFNGMKGSGFLYIRKGINLHALVDGGSQEYGKRAGTENIAAIVAMAVALKKNCVRMEESAKKLHSLEKIFLKRLSEAKIDYIRNGNSAHLPGNVNISIRDNEGEMLLHRLDLKGICISTGSACDSFETQVSHVIKAIGVPDEYAKGTIRITFGNENTEEEAAAVANALINIIKASRV